MSEGIRIKHNWIYIGILVIVIILAIVLISNSNKNPQDSVTCNSPYIKVGTSCCLDENSNNICDNEEQIKEETNTWKLNSFSVDGGTLEDFTKCSSTYPGSKDYVFNNLLDKSNEDIEMALFHQYAGEPEGYGRQNEDYQTAVLIVYADYNPTFYENYEEVTCEIEEYYDGVFNEVNTHKFDYDFGLPEDKYGLFINLFYSKNDKPSEAKYIISCKGNESGKEVKRTFRFDIDYVDKVVVRNC